MIVAADVRRLKSAVQLPGHKMEPPFVGCTLTGKLLPLGVKHLGQRAYSAFAQASPSAPGPASISFSTFQFLVSMTAICLLESHETYASSPSGRTNVS